MLRRKGFYTRDGLSTGSIETGDGVGHYIHRKADQRLLSSEAVTGDEEEQRLERLVFGSGQPFGADIDKFPEADEDDTSSNSEDERTDELQSVKKKPKNAWSDEDDELVKVNLTETSKMRQLRRMPNEDTVSGRELSSRLRQQFQKISRQPEWAIGISNKRTGGSSGEEEGSDDEDNDSLLKRTGPLLASRVSRLPRDTIDLKFLRDANRQKPAPAVIQSVEFHPSAHVILTAGRHKTLSLFQVDGETNPFIQSVHLERFPILTARFTPDGEEVIIAGERHWFYVFDMTSGQIVRINEIKGYNRSVFSSFRVSPDNKLLAFLGKNGYIPLVSNKTKQWIADLKMNGDVEDVAFTPDNKHLLSTGSDGHVYVWDLSTRDCVHRFIDDGCIKGTSLAVSSTGSHIASGSNSGVVNLYDSSCLLQQKPKPVKSIMNLTTSINALNFNHSNEILSISSNSKMSAFKLFHVPSLSVFSNWPTQKTPLKTVYSHSFSADSQYMVIGNDEGKALLYRFNHYHVGYSTLNN